LNRVVKFIHSVIFWALVVFYTTVIDSFYFALGVFIKDENRRIALYRRGAKLWGTLLVNASGIKVKISGLENIPYDTNVIFTPNHQSYLDIFILLKYLPGQFAFVIMRNLFKVPIIGHYITQAGFLSLDRKDRKKSIGTIHSIIDLLKKGESFVIFPEGKLTRDASIGEFGRGTSIIIQHGRKPVVPIAIDGTFDALPKGAWMLGQAEVKVTIGKPVHFEEHQGEINKNTSLKLSDELRGIVQGLKNKGRA
jgi:1-acyl-sn-glycerol-3-phosphate acyltransferase